MNEILNAYKISNSKLSEDINENSKHLLNAIHDNVQNVSSQTVSAWSKQMDSAMNGLSESIQKSHKNNNDFITDKMQKNLNHFDEKSNACHDELLRFNETQCKNISDVSKSLQSHKQCMSDYAKRIETHHNESNLPYFEQLSADLSELKRESEVFSVSKYQKTGETPLKQSVIYPLKFVETEPLENLISQFNESVADENKNPLNQSGASSYVSSLKSTRSSSPFFIKEEIEINFAEKELGFRMYAGDGNKNCFIRHCHSDVRVADNAQIISIDGLDCVDKSVGYIRTLLATEQRPIAIKFKNNLEDSCRDGDKPSIGDLNVSAVSTSSVLSDTFVNVTTKKRKKRDIVKPKVKKLNYATPNKKRHKRNLSSLSPINADENACDDKMDVDNMCSDIE